MDIYEYNGEDFNAILKSDGWKVGFLRYSERFSAECVKERHLLSDEAFVLLFGNAELIVEGKHFKMQKCKLYNVKKGEWHHIVVSHDATVLVIENSSTSSENTEKAYT